MMSDEALRRIHAWEREHGHSAEQVEGHIRYKTPLGPGLPPLSHEECLEGAGLWLDYQHALREEEKSRRLAEADRSEIWLEALEPSMREGPGRSSA